MQRGILTLNRDELLELGKSVNSEKIKIALENLKEENRILINEEELENILDEIGMPEDNTVLKSAVEKVSDLLHSFRNI
jgi:PHD/YefM family antitoxin component YafN of YafNO toxin-antitoxin module